VVTLPRVTHVVLAMKTEASVLTVRNSYDHVGFEVLTAVLVKNTYHHMGYKCV
jgi:hypothetical protein